MNLHEQCLLRYLKHPDELLYATEILKLNNKITKTIISTNLNLKEIFNIYNERIGSRFVGHYNICKFIGEDIRFKK